MGQRSPSAAADAAPATPPPLHSGRFAGADSRRRRRARTAIGAAVAVATTAAIAVGLAGVGMGVGGRSNPASPSAYREFSGFSESGGTLVVEDEYSRAGRPPLAQAYLTSRPELAAIVEPFRGGSVVRWVCMYGCR